MKHLLSILLLTSFVAVNSQSIEEREHDLRSYFSGEWGKKKPQALELLEIDPFNLVAIDYLLQLYQKNDQQDSISIYWDQLIAKHPDHPIPLLRRVELAKYERLSRDEEIAYLDQAYALDPKQKAVNYLLAEMNYEKFLEANSPAQARHTIQFLDNLCELGEQYKPYMKVPLIQLSHYLKDTKKLEIVRDYPDRHQFFPILPFANLKEGWETDYSNNVFWSSSQDWYSPVSGIETAQFTIRWYSKHLSALEEPVLFDTIPSTTYRFTWLRSFHPPVVIRVELGPESSMIHWKMGNGAGGYKPGKIIKNKSRKLKDNEVLQITSTLDSLNFFHLPTNQSDMIGTDGAQWILEGVENGTYHVVDRWMGGEIKPFCLQLLRLTSLSIKDREMY